MTKKHASIEKEDESIIYFDVSSLVYDNASVEYSKTKIGTDLYILNLSGIPFYYSFFDENNLMQSGCFHE